MSALLEDLIRQGRLEADEYAEFLRKAEDLIKKIASREFAEGIPTPLHGRPDTIVIYRNLPQILDKKPGEMHENQFVELALNIDQVLSEQAPAGWKGDQPKEAQVKNALYLVLDCDPIATEKLFDLVKNQPGY